MLVPRIRHIDALMRRLRQVPVVALLGSRQVGKTTLAREVSRRWRGPVTTFDLEDRRDLALLDEPTLALAPLRGLVILDEVQNRPDLFSVLRVLADRPRRPARFLVLGSASPDLLKQGSETLAGRIGFYELSGFDLEEVGPGALDRLWFRGGLPRSFLARTHEESATWRREFIRTFVERDLPRLAGAMPAGDVARFWGMLAHYHAQVWNGSELGRSLGVAHTTVRRYLDMLASTFVVTVLPPWHENVGKRLVKSPKVYLADSGLLHALLGIDTPSELLRHPKLGASWEGFVLGQIVRRLGARPDQCYFWATHAGAELDLLVLHRGRRLGFEIKRTDAPRITASLRSAIDSLHLDRAWLVHAGDRCGDLEARVRAVAAGSLLEEMTPLGR